MHPFLHQIRKVDHSSAEIFVIVFVTTHSHCQMDVAGHDPGERRGQNA